MQSRHVTLDTGLDYHLLEWGADQPHDHTVLLLHGFLDVCWGWQRTVEAGLAGRYHIIAPDMRGHGDSGRVGAGGYYYFMDYLADVHSLVRKFARARLSIVGHSMGGSIASYYSGAFPKRVGKLAMLEGLGPPSQSGGGPERVVAWLNGWQRVRESVPRRYGSIEEAAARLREHDKLLSVPISQELAERGTLQDPDGKWRFKHDPLHATSGPYGYQIEVAERFWRAITCPVLLIDGDRSEYQVADGDARQACFANRRHAVLAGAGHMMQRHQPAALAQLLGDFLSEPDHG